MNAGICKKWTDSGQVLCRIAIFITMIRKRENAKKNVTANSSSRNLQPVFVSLFISSLFLMACTDQQADIHWENATIQPNTPLEVNGEKVFLLELYDLKDSVDFSHAQLLGFNATIGHHHDLPALTDCFDFYLTDAHWVQGTKQINHLIDKAENMPDHGRLVSHNLNDEPDLRRHSISPVTLKEAAEKLKVKFPDRKTSITLSGIEDTKKYWPEYNDALDIVRVDPYPVIEELPLNFVDTLITAAKDMTSHQKPVITILQAWTAPRLAGPFPQWIEIQHMAYRSLIRGTNGISYFSWDPYLWNYHQNYAGQVLNLNHNIEQNYRPFLVEGDYWGVAESGDVLAAKWTLGADWLIIVTNGANDSSLVSIAYPSFTESAWQYAYNQYDPVLLSANQTMLKIGPLSTVILSSRFFRQTNFGGFPYLTLPPLSVPPLPEEHIVRNLMVKKGSAGSKPPSLGALWNSLPLTEINTLSTDTTTTNNSPFIQFHLVEEGDRLVLTMKAETPHELRNETSSGMRYFVGDDIMVLHFSDRSGTRRKMQFNANGIARMYSDEYDQIGYELPNGVEVEMVNRKKWYARIELSFKSMNLHNLDQANFNPGYSFSIAPKQKTMFNPE